MTQHVTLEDKYDLGVERVLVSGTQALVRAALMQHERDRKAGLNTAGYVTGYRGSPLGGLDQQFMRAAKYLAPHSILFQPGLNEDLAATALWGSQQAEMRGEGRFDGVFGMWYGKGPGVDRSGDVFRHANAAGSSKHGGVLVLMGDDHAAESSTVPHQSEFALLDAMMPILNPAGVQEILDYSLYGFALSRYSGTWVGIKCVHDNVESTAIIEAGPSRAQSALPTDFEMPKGGLNIRAADDRFEQELRLHTYKRFAAVAFARANKLDRIVLQGGAKAKIGIVTAGKSYLDTREALEELGIDESRAAKLGLRLLKLGTRLAGRSNHHREIRRRSRSHHCGGGEAVSDRDARQRATLQYQNPRQSSSASATRTKRICFRPSARSSRTRSRSPWENGWSPSPTTRT